ncbi:MAG: hypothetical protein ABW204_06055 [Microbacteriaceae bacterium]
MRNHAEPNPYDERKVTEQVAAHLYDRFPQVDHERVDAVAAERVHAFADARIKDYVGPLAEHQARAELSRAS